MVSLQAKSFANCLPSTFPGERSPFLCWNLLCPFGPLCAPFWNLKEIPPPMAAHCRLLPLPHISAKSKCITCRRKSGQLQHVGDNVNQFGEGPHPTPYSWEGLGQMSALQHFLSRCSLPQAPAAWCEDLIVAVDADDLGAARHLLEAGQVDVNGGRPNGADTALHAACKQGNAAMVALLLQVSWSHSWKSGDVK